MGVIHTDGAEALNIAFLTGPPDEQSAQNEKTLGKPSTLRGVDMVKGEIHQGIYGYLR
jgi:hypothetical protein